MFISIEPWSWIWFRLDDCLKPVILSLKHKLKVSSLLLELVLRVIATLDWPVRFSNCIYDGQERLSIASYWTARWKCVFVWFLFSKEISIIMKNTSSPAKREIHYFRAFVLCLCLHTRKFELLRSVLFWLYYFLTVWLEFFNPPCENVGKLQWFGDLYIDYTLSGDPENYSLIRYKLFKSLLLS